MVDINQSCNDEDFVGLNLSGVSLSANEYEYCNFRQCNFENAILDDAKFMDCSFEECNLSMTKLNNTFFQSVRFDHCKMLGLDIEVCSDFGFKIQLSNCDLSHSVFYKRRLKGTAFLDCVLAEVDFSFCDLTEASFERSNLLRTNFEGAILKKANFIDVVNLSIDPDQVSLAGAQFNLPSALNLLDKFNIDLRLD